MIFSLENGKVLCESDAGTVESFSPNDEGGRAFRKWASQTRESGFTWGEDGAMLSFDYYFASSVDFPEEEGVDANFKIKEWVIGGEQ